MSWQLLAGAGIALGSLALTTHASKLARWATGRPYRPLVLLGVLYLASKALEFAAPSLVGRPSTLLWIGIGFGIGVGAVVRSMLVADVSSS